MKDLRLIEKTIVLPEEPTKRRRLFLSNIDLTLLGYDESVLLFGPPINGTSFDQICRTLYRALAALLVHYDFFAGRLVTAMDDSGRLEIDCNGAGIVVAAARTDSVLSEFGELCDLKPEFKQLTAFLHEEKEKDMEDMPLLQYQLTQFGCGSLGLALRFNHCTADGVTIHEVIANLASLTCGNEIVIVPNLDRTIFKARNPPVINHPHFEYSKSTEPEDSFVSRMMKPPRSPHPPTKTIHLSPRRIGELKKEALKDGKLQNCTIFQVVAAKIWKSRSVALNIPREKYSNMLFPIEGRKKVVPEAPRGFSGNAIFPGYARARVSKLVAEEESDLVRRVQEGIERLDDEYIRSSIDWLEVNRGMHWGEESFSVVAQWKLGLDDGDFVWGRAIGRVPIELKPGLVALLPGPREAGGINVCFEMDENRAEVFRRLMVEGEEE